MEPKNLLQADYLDIIYDKRNKGYGGYELRKNYSSRVKKGVGFLMLGLSAIVSFSFISERERSHVVDVKPTVTHVTDLFIPETPPVPPPPKTQMAPPPPPVKSRIFMPPVITDDPIKPEQEMANVKDLKEFNPGPKNSDSGSDIASITPPIEGPTGPAGPVTVVTPPPIPVFVEQMPQPYGDMAAYLSKNIVYPPNAREANIQGRVGIQFVVNEDGSITNAHVIRSLGGGCDEEALRVIKAMPKWKPGKNNGTAVKVMFTQVIMFTLQ